VSKARGEPRGKGLDHGPHTRLAPGTSSPPHRAARDDQPASARRRPSATQPAETTEIVLRPLRRRTTQRTLTSRLHPLVARRRHSRRNPRLARRPRPLRPLRDRTPPRHRPHRPSRISQNRATTRHSVLNANRQRHGVHHPPRRRQRRPQRLRSPRHHPGRTTSATRRLHRRLQPPPPTPIPATPRHPSHHLRGTTQSRPQQLASTPTTASAPNASAKPDQSPCASMAACTTSASAASPNGPTRKNRGPKEGPRLFQCPATSHGRADRI
jgi:hypothetical protein